jgi:Mn2+/Fe2+ NRAMP family transporter
MHRGRALSARYRVARDCLLLASTASEIIRNSLVPSVPEGGITASYVFLVIAIVGTTIAPWQLFFQQSCVADKRLRLSDLRWARLDTLLGAVFTIAVAGCMVIAGNASKVHGIPFVDPAQMADALRPFTGSGVRTAICS